MSDRKRLLAALREVGATSLQVKMAAMLLAVNGIENALGYVEGIQAKGLTHKPTLFSEQADG